MSILIQALAAAIIHEAHPPVIPPPMDDCKSGLITCPHEKTADEKPAEKDEK